MNKSLHRAHFGVAGLKAQTKEFKTRTANMKFTVPELFEQHFDKSSQSTLLKVPFVPLYEVPFTPLCKHFTQGKRVAFGAPIQTFERDYIKIVRNMIIKHHGPEQLHYSQDDDDLQCATVDA